MPRRPRLSVPGVPLHLIQRGNHCACFYADEDYGFYLDHLAEQATKRGCQVHAYCPMTNHVHLCYRYIELNPVRAGIVAHPADYRWSSYRGNAQGEIEQALGRRTARGKPGRPVKRTEAPSESLLE